MEEQNIRHPITINEIEFYFRSYLKLLTEEESLNNHIVTFDKSKWRQTHGFKRSFTVHGAFINDDTNEYAFHLDEWKDNTHPFMGIYESFDEMISEVAHMYHSVWTLGKRGDEINEEIKFKPRKIRD